MDTRDYPYAIEFKPRSGGAWRLRSVYPTYAQASRVAEELTEWSDSLEYRVVCTHLREVLRGVESTE